MACRTRSECKGPGQQTADYLFSTWRVLQLEPEWHPGLPLIKLDLAKAFDSVCRESLLQQQEERVGNGAEMRCRRALLQQSLGTLNLKAP